MTERQEVLRRTEVQWVDADCYLPDSPRKVLVMYESAHGVLSPMEARYSLGWRFLSTRCGNRRVDRIRAWMDIPWWDRHESKQSKAQAAATKPAGAKARAEVEAETQTYFRANRTDPVKTTCLSQAEAEFSQ